jgi:hypothetical protein
MITKTLSKIKMDLKARVISLNTILFIFSSQFVFSQIEFNLKGDINRIESVAFRKDCNLIFYSADTRTQYFFNVDSVGIYEINLYPLHKNIYVYGKLDSKIKIDYDLINFSLKIENSLETKDLNDIESLWLYEMNKLKLSVKNEDLYKNTIVTFDILTNRILEINNQEVMDWAALFLFSVEKPDEYYIPNFKFKEFESLALQKGFTLPEFNKLLKIRNIDQNPIKWK